MADSSFFSSAFSSAKNLNPFKQSSEKDIDPDNTNSSTTSDNIKDSVQNASAAISDVFTDAKDAVVDGAKGAAEKVGEIASDVKDAVVEKTTEVKDYVVGNSQDAAEHVEGAAVEAKDEVVESTEVKVVEETHEEKSSGVVEKAEEAVSDAKDAISAVLSDTKNKIEEIVSQAKETVVDEAHKADDAKTDVVEEVFEAKTVAVDGAAAAAESDDVKVVEGTPAVENVVEELKKDAVEHSENAVEKVEEAAAHIQDSVDPGVTSVPEDVSDVKDAVVESADYVAPVSSDVVVDEAAEQKSSDSTVVLVNGLTATGEPILGTVTVTNEPQSTSEDGAHAEPEAAKSEQDEPTVQVHVNPAESEPAQQSEPALSPPELVATQESTEAHQGSVEGSVVAEPVSEVKESVAESAAVQESAEAHPESAEETITSVHVSSTESAPESASEPVQESAPAQEFISLEDHATPAESEIHQHVIAEEEQIPSHPAQEFIPVGEHEPVAAFSEHTDAHPDVSIPEVAQESTDVKSESVEEPITAVHVTASESEVQQDVVSAPEGDSAQISGAAQDFIPLDGHSPVADSVPEAHNDNVEETFTEVHVVSTESAPEAQPESHPAEESAPEAQSESHPAEESAQEAQPESHPTEVSAEHDSTTEPLALEKPTEVSVPEVVPAAESSEPAVDAVDVHQLADASVPKVAPSSNAQEAESHVVPAEETQSGSVEEPITSVHVHESESAPAPAQESSDNVEEQFVVAHHQVAESAPAHADNVQEDQQPESARSIESYLNESTPESNDESFEKIDHSQVEATQSDITLSEHSILSDPVEKVVVATVAAVAVGATGEVLASEVAQVTEETQSSQKPKATLLSELRMSHETAFPVPYRSKLVEPFEPGQTLIVKGKTGEDSIRFTVNLHSHTADFSGNDVPLHISVRFDEGKLVFNTFAKGEWGKEERKSNPYKKGDDIDIRIRAHDSKFQIFVDQKEVKEYEHRVPLSSITHFTIDGDVLVNYIHWGGKYYPVPYESGLAGEGLAPGKTLTIFGIPEKKAKRFHINLLKKNGDIALHLNSRFDEKHVVRNSLISNAWGNEEREGKLPFEKAVGFDLEIHNEPYALSINVNGERFASYAHRLSPDDINGLQIGGDVEITGIQIA